MTTKIFQIDNTDPQFYTIIGPFLARREVTKEIGGVPYDDDGKQWFVARNEHETLGFVAAKPEGDSVRFCSAYVAPKWRRLGVYSQLVAARDKVFRDRACYVIARREVVHTLRASGFKKTGAKGGYLRMERAGAVK